MFEPRKSEDFKPSIMEPYGKLSDRRIEEQQELREDMCLGTLVLDTHFTVYMDGEEQRFNMAKSSAACSSNWQGKKPKREELLRFANDPARLSEAVDKAAPYNDIVKKMDPRRKTTTVIMRDYACKIPLTDPMMNDMVKAVLHDYPAQYTAFLEKFVSSTMGDGMKAYLRGVKEGLSNLLAKPEYMNQMCWHMYYGLVGDVSVAPRSLEVEQHDLTGTSTLAGTTTITESGTKAREAISEYSLRKTENGSIDMRPCIRQHIATLEMMIEMCKGFGTAEMDAVVMLKYAEDQGKNMCDDKMLIDRSEKKPVYDRVRVHVPINPQVKGEERTIGKELADEEDASIRHSESADRKRTVRVLPSVTYDVGTFAQLFGNMTQTSFGRKPVFPLQWGWGHSSTLAYVSSSDSGAAALPFLDVVDVPDLQDALTRTLNPGSTGNVPIINRRNNFGLFDTYRAATASSMPFTAGDSTFDIVKDYRDELQNMVDAFTELGARIGTIPATTSEMGVVDGILEEEKDNYESLRAKAVALKSQHVNIEPYLTRMWDQVSARIQLRLHLQGNISFIQGFPRPSDTAPVVADFDKIPSVLATTSNSINLLGELRQLVLEVKSSTRKLTRKLEEYRKGNPPGNARRDLTRSSTEFTLTFLLIEAFSNAFEGYNPKVDSKLPIKLFIVASMLLAIHHDIGPGANLRVNPAAINQDDSIMVVKRIVKNFLARMRHQNPSLADSDTMAQCLKKFMKMAIGHFGHYNVDVEMVYLRMLNDNDFPTVKRRHVDNDAERRDKYLERLQNLEPQNLARAEPFVEKFNSCKNLARPEEFVSLAIKSAHMMNDYSLDGRSKYRAAFRPIPNGPPQLPDPLTGTYPRLILRASQARKTRPTKMPLVQKGYLSFLDKKQCGVYPFLKYTVGSSEFKVDMDGAKKWDAYVNPGVGSYNSEPVNKKDLATAYDDSEPLLSQIYGDKKSNFVKRDAFRSADTYGSLAPKESRPVEGHRELNSSDPWKPLMSTFDRCEEEGLLSVIAYDKDRCITANNWLTSWCLEQRGGKLLFPTRILTFKNSVVKIALEKLNQGKESCSISSSRLTWGNMKFPTEVNAGTLVCYNSRSKALISYLGEVMTLPQLPPAAGGLPITLNGASTAICTALNNQGLQLSEAQKSMFKSECMRCSKCFLEIPNGADLSNELDLVAGGSLHTRLTAAAPNRWSPIEILHEALTRTAPNPTPNAEKESVYRLLSKLCPTLYCILFSAEQSKKDLVYLSGYTLWKENDFLVGMLKNQALADKKIANYYGEGGIPAAIPGAGPRNGQALSKELMKKDPKYELTSCLFTDGCMWEPMLLNKDSTKLVDNVKGKFKGSDETETFHRIVVPPRHAMPSKEDTDYIKNFIRGNVNCAYYKKLEEAIEDVRDEIVRLGPHTALQCMSMRLGLVLKEFFEAVLLTDADLDAIVVGAAALALPPALLASSAGVKHIYTSKVVEYDSNVRDCIRGDPAKTYERADKIENVCSVSARACTFPIYALAMSGEDVKEGSGKHKLANILSKAFHDARHPNPISEAAYAQDEESSVCAVDIRKVIRRLKRETKKKKDKDDSDDEEESEDVDISLIGIEPILQMKAHVLILRQALATGLKSPRLAATILEGGTFMADPKIIALCDEFKCPLFPQCTILEGGKKMESSLLKGEMLPLPVSPNNATYYLNGKMELCDHTKEPMFKDSNSEKAKEQQETKFWEILLRDMLYSADLFLSASPSNEKERRKIASRYFVMTAEADRRADLAKSVLESSAEKCKWDHVKVILERTLKRLKKENGGGPYPAGYDAGRWVAANFGNVLLDPEDGLKAAYDALDDFLAGPPANPADAMSHVKRTLFIEMATVMYTDPALRKQFKADTNETTIPSDVFMRELKDVIEENIKSQHGNDHRGVDVEDIKGLYLRMRRWDQKRCNLPGAGGHHTRLTACTPAATSLFHFSGGGPMFLFDYARGAGGVAPGVPRVEADMQRQHKKNQRFEQILTFISFVMKQDEIDMYGSSDTLTTALMSEVDVASIKGELTSIDPNEIPDSANVPLEMYVNTAKVASLPPLADEAYYPQSLMEYATKRKEFWEDRVYKFDEKYKKVKASHLLLGVPTSCGKAQVYIDGEGYPMPVEPNLSPWISAMYSSVEFSKGINRLKFVGSEDPFTKGGLSSEMVHASLSAEEKGLFDDYLTWCTDAVRGTPAIAERDVGSSVYHQRSTTSHAAHGVRVLVGSIARLYPAEKQEQKYYRKRKLYDISQAYRGSDTYRGDGGGTYFTAHAFSTDEIELPHCADCKTAPPLDPNGVQVAPHNFLFFPAGRSDESFPRPDFHGARVNVCKPQLYSMLDAHALLMQRRSFFNVSDCNRADEANPKMKLQNQCDAAHYWVDTLSESFLVARERFATEDDTSSYFEQRVKKVPNIVFPTSRIGDLCRQTRRELFPLLPDQHPIWDKLRKVRAMNCLWAELPSYMMNSDDPSTLQSGAWIPVSVANHVRLLKEVGLFDEQRMLPSNPWFSGKVPLGQVYSQSSHSVYTCADYTKAHFKEWQEKVLPYRPPSDDLDSCYYPFTEYGGDPVMGDFVRHRVEEPTPTYASRHRHLLAARFGMTGPFRLGTHRYDRGMLQDMFSFQYRDKANLTEAQRELNKVGATHFRISSFMAYARNHAIMALNSGFPCSPNALKGMIARNMFRIYVDSYKYVQGRDSDETVPFVMGFKLNDNVLQNRVVTVYAGTLDCMYQKISERSIAKSLEAAHFEAATQLFTKLNENARTEIYRMERFSKVKQFRPELEFVDFLKEELKVASLLNDYKDSVILSMVAENGGDPAKIPRHLMRRKILKVPAYGVDDDLLPQDMRDPKRIDEVRHIMKSGGDMGLTEKQIALMWMLPLNEAWLAGYTSVKQEPTDMSLKFARERMFNEARKKNDNALERRAAGAWYASVAANVLSLMGVSMDDLNELPWIKDELLAPPPTDPYAAKQSFPKGTLLTSGPSLSPHAVNKLNPATLPGPVTKGEAKAARESIFRSVDSAFGAEPDRYSGIVENTLSSARALLEEGMSVDRIFDKVLTVPRDVERHVRDML